MRKMKSRLEYSGVQLDENYVLALNYLGQSLGYQARFQEAINTFKKVLEIDSNFKEAWNNLGVVFSSIKNINDAINSFKKALELDPNYKDAKKNLELIKNYKNKRV